MKRTRLLLALTAGLTAFLAAAEGKRENEIDIVNEVEAVESTEASCDLRTVFPVAKQKDEPALQGLNYSARGWRLDVSTEDSARTAEITAEPGEIVDGVFQRGEGAAVTVLPAIGGEGTVDWQAGQISKCVYRLKHMVLVGGVSDAEALCYGYLDFTHCVTEKATQEEVELAVFGRFSHKIGVVQDADLPWQPIESGVASVGIMTDAGLASAASTATTFNFKGRGTLHYEYTFSDGSLVVRADGATVGALAASAEWREGGLRFEDFGTHVVSFAYTVANGGQAAIRNVYWEEEDGSARVKGEGGETRVDLREGVRTAANRDEILPFVYSSTNWIGDVEEATTDSLARVTIVQLTGTVPDVKEWVAMSGTATEFVRKVGEGAKKWKPKKGVWKATFDILNGDTSVRREEAWFDLRKTSIPGFMLMLK